MLSNALDTCLVIGLSVALRVLVSTYPHSGSGRSPMYGDYEAQRHWQEITVSLPVHKWYHNSTDNDLLYWGLDYPPLTAYHSYLMGQIAYRIDTDYVALHKSRGMEAPRHKAFMRLSVVACDLLIFIPAVILLAYSLHPQQWQARERLALIALLTLYPGLILIDSGHFQYNNVSLGLFILTIWCFSRSRDLWGSLMFSLAVNYKQMELYHALPVFFYLLSKCWREPTWFRKIYKLVAIAFTVCTVFAILWLPFLDSVSSALQVLKRIFPFNRGLFEDKVANFWCSLNVLYKLRTNAVLLPWLPIICGTITLLASVPTNVYLCRYPTIKNLVISSSITSLAFFLFSFQVHEKSILLAAIPVAIACSLLKHERSSSLFHIWFLIISVMSMLPLLIKDGLAIPTTSLTIVYLIGSVFSGYLQSTGVARSGKHALNTPATYTYPASVQKRFFSPTSRQSSVPVPISVPQSSDYVKYSIFAVSICGAFLLEASALFVSPPSHLPDLWAVLISLYSAVHFGLFWIYCNWLQWMQKPDISNVIRDEKKKKN